MNKELKARIKKFTTRSNICLAAILLFIQFFLLGVILLFVPSWIAAIFLTFAACFMGIIVYIHLVIKKEKSVEPNAPIVLDMDKTLSFEDATNIFRSLAAKGDILSLSENLHFFRFKKIFSIRAILYKPESFNKKDFKSAKNKINKKANEQFKISEWVSGSKAAKMMRLNIIFADTINDELKNLVSMPANHNLSRVEGVVNIAIVKNEVFIPPLQSDLYLIHINRYKNTIKFIEEVLYA